MLRVSRLFLALNDPAAGDVFESCFALACCYEYPSVNRTLGHAHLV